MTVATKPITAEDLLAMGDIGRCELVRGEIVMMSPAGAEHGDVAGEVFRLIANYVKQRRLGKTYAAETGFKIIRSPDTVRAPDAAFVRAARVPKKRQQGYFDGPPDLAIEVVSPGDTLSEALAKIDEWLTAGTISVWLIDPQNRTIDVYRPGGQVIRHRDSDVLKDEPTLPGFELPLTDLFPKD
jgi:Uma2 family endonuclease